MDSVEIQNKIDELYYWDSWVKELSCNYFADEVKLVYDDDEYDVIYNFTGCYNVEFNHEIGHTKEKPIRECKFNQLAYSMQSVKVTIVVIEEKEFYEFKININPLELKIVCKDIKIEQIPKKGDS